MNATENLQAFVIHVSQHTILSRLLLASIEFAALALIVSAAIRVGRIRSPRLTSILWLLVLAKPIVSLLVGSPLCLLQMQVPAVVNNVREMDGMAQNAPLLPTTDHGESIGNQSAVVDGEKTASGIIEETTAQPATSPSGKVHWQRLARRIAFTPQAIVGLWIVGVVVFASMAIVDRCRLWRLLAAARAPSEPCLSHYAAIAATLGLKRRPRLLITDELESPALAGVIAPVILIPSWLARENRSHKLDWALRHELMHWRMLDPLAGFVREVAQILFYFHPAAWWAGKKWEEAAELACDRALVASEAESADYADQLYQMLVVVRDQRRLRLSAGLFATRTQIGRRIAALLAGPLNTPSRLSGLAVVTMIGIAALTLTVGIGFAQKASQPESKPATASKATDQTSPADATVVISGQVLDPAGKPLAGAKLQLEYYRITQPATEYGPSYSTTSGPDGQFQFNVPHADLAKASRDDYWNSARVVATSEGYGFDEQRVPREDAAQPLKLQLVTDVPIDGRILDIEGRPVVGARLRVKTVRWTPGVNLDSFVEESREGRNTYGFKMLSNRQSFGPDPLVTGSDGRFTFAGIGAERVVWLDVEGPAIEYGSIEVATREMPAAIFSAGSGSLLGQQRRYGAKFEHVAPPSRTIVGIVRDQATGQPIAGATVHGWSNYVAKTDESGRYELLGYAKSPQYRLQFFPPDGQPYFRANVTISDTPGLEPLEKDIQLSAGSIVRGRLTDQRTGQPIVGRVDYHPLFPNEYVAELDSVGQPASATAIQSDGQFAISVFSGPGVLGFKSDGIDDSEYAPAFVSAEELQELFQGKPGWKHDEGFLPIAAGGQAQGIIGQAQYRALVLINPAVGQASLTKDVALQPSPRVRGTVVGPDGQPLLGAAVFGLPPSTFSSKTLKTADFEVLGLNPKRPHSLLFTHEEQQLGASFTIRGDEAAPLTVRLLPLGSATGRLLSLEGNPVPNTTLDFCRARMYGPGVRTAKTDAAGRFRVDGLATGQKYDAILWWPRSLVSIRFACRDVSVEPGQTTELGDLKVMTAR